MIYKYTVENGILEQRSLFQIPFKSANGYTVRIDDKILVNGLDYSIDGSRLWIERDIAGKVFSISDSVEDETEVLLTKISELKTSFDELKARTETLADTTALTNESLETFKQAMARKDEEYINAIAGVSRQVSLDSLTLENLRANVEKELSSLTDIVADTETKLSNRITEVLNTSTSNYSTLNREIAKIDDRLINNDTIVSLNSKYEQLSRDISELKDQITNIPAGIDDEFITMFTEKLSSLKQSLAMEVAQRRRADMEIKLLLERVIEDMARLEDIIIGNLGDDEIVTGILTKLKEEFNTSLDRLARITTANMTRAFKLKQVVSDIKGGSI